MAKTYERLSTDRLLELSKTLLRVLSDKVSNAILRKELTKVVQIDLQHAAELTEPLLLLNAVVNQVVRYAWTNANLQGNHASLSFQEDLDDNQFETNDTFTLASRSPYLMNSSSLFPRSSSLTSSPRARQTAHAMVL